MSQLSEAPFSLVRLTLATTETERMAAFYTGVFAADLQPVAAYGTTLYRGSLAGVPLVLCPNVIAGVVAEQSRHQITLLVPELTPLLDQVRAHGGRVLGHPDSTTATVADPDGNTLELVQVPPESP
ncbi:MAG TPA: VOC family protein [Roseiflexaceae bacterium]|nr:VOC family protein [Roseiflexaceae bacterium]